MSAFIIFLAYALIICVLLGLLYWGLQSVNLPQPVKTAIIIIVVAMGVIFFVQGGYIESFPRR
jgi:uncharacterized membrane protein YwzB